jgi:hypothetical protein
VLCLLLWRANLNGRDCAHNKCVVQVGYLGAKRRDRLLQHRLLHHACLQYSLKLAPLNLGGGRWGICISKKANR